MVTVVFIQSPLTSERAVETPGIYDTVCIASGVHVGYLRLEEPTPSIAVSLFGAPPGAETVNTHVESQVIRNKLDKQSRHAIYYLYMYICTLIFFFFPALTKS